MPAVGDASLAELVIEGECLGTLENLSNPISIPKIWIECNVIGDPIIALDYWDLSQGTWTETEIRIPISGYVVDEIGSSLDFRKIALMSGDLHINNGSVILNIGPIDIPYCLQSDVDYDYNNGMVYDKYRKKILADNSTGSFQFKIHPDIANHCELMGAINYAMDSWKCATGVNWEYDIVDFNPALVINGESEIYFNPGLANTTTLAQSGVFGERCGFFYEVNEADIIINPSIFTAINGSDDKKVLAEIITHEFGHALGLCHTLIANLLGSIDEEDVMSPGSNDTEITLDLTEDDQQGAQTMFYYSTTGNCVPYERTDLSNPEDYCLPVGAAGTGVEYSLYHIKKLTFSRTINDQDNSDNFNSKYSSFQCGKILEIARGYPAVNLIILELDWLPDEIDFKIWIDFDKDKEIDSEEVMSRYSSFPGTTNPNPFGNAVTVAEDFDNDELLISFFIPDNVALGETMMRVSVRNGVISGEPSLVGVFSDGEVEDYTVKIIPSINVPNNCRIGKVDSWSISSQSRKKLSEMSYGLSCNLQELKRKMIYHACTDIVSLVTERGKSNIKLKESWEKFYSTWLLLFMSLEIPTKTPSFITKYHVLVLNQFLNELVHEMPNNTMRDELLRIKDITFVMEGKTLEQGLIALDQYQCGVYKTEMKQNTKVVSLANKDIHIYPNPSYQEIVILEIYAEDNEVEEVDIILYDINGKVVLKTREVQYEGANKYQLDTSNLPAGEYLVKVVNGKTSTVNKLIIMR